MADWQITLLAWEAFKIALGFIPPMPIVTPAEAPPGECRQLDQETPKLVPCPAPASTPR